MSKKINKVFLNATAEQIEEYGLQDGVTNFSEMDKLIETVKADLAKKAAERVYSIAKGFTIIDGAADASVDLKAIATENKYKLSAVDFDKIISEATKVLYTSEGTVDHRIASFEAVGEGEVKNLNMQYDWSEKVYRSDYAPTAAGEKKYEEAIAEAKKNAVDAGVWSDSKIVGYKDLVIENSGVEATVTTEGEKMARVATITKPTAVSAIGGTAAIDYQYDSTKALDRKDEKLVVENFTENEKWTEAASGSVTVKNSQVGDIKGEMSEQVAELKKLHPNANFDDLAWYADESAGYETVTIDNSTVLGSIVGGSQDYVSTSTGSKDIFLDKQDLSGAFYGEATATPHDANEFSTDNDVLYSYVETFKMTEKEAEAKAKELSAKAVAGAKIENIVVNKYEIVELGLNNSGDDTFGQIKTGKYVYLSNEEWDALSSANRAKLDFVEGDVGHADFAGREVTDENFMTFTKEPTGNQLNTVSVYKTEFFDVGGKSLGIYYLKAIEVPAIRTALGADSATASESFYRVAETVTAENYKTEATADKVYPKYSDYSTCTFRKEMTAAEADEANKALMAEADQQAWIKGTGSDESVLFTVEKISGGKEVTYYLTAEELSNLGAFGKDGDGKNIVKTTAEVDVAGAFDAATGWVFVDAGKRTTLDADDNQLYRAGDAATEATLENFKTLTDTNSSNEQPCYYELKDVVYGDQYYIATKLKNAGDFAAYLGENGEYVVDGEIQYRAAGYNLSGNIQDSAHVSSDKKTINKAEYSYSASITTSLTEEDAAGNPNAYLTDGELAQNKRIFKDAYVNAGEDQYITLDKAQDSYTHEFIDVYAAQVEQTSVEVLNGGFVGLDTGVQKKDDDGKALYVKYDVATKKFVSTTDDKVNNVAVVAYEKGGVVYALTDAEATAIGGFTKLTDDKAKQYYRSYTVGAAEAGTIDNFAVTSLNEFGALYSFELANATTALEACNKVTKVYDAEGAGDYSARLTVTVGGEEKDAFYNSVTKTLTADEKATYNAIYVYTKDANTYYMTEAEAAKATGAVKGAQATDVTGKYMFRIAEGTSTQLADYAIKYANYFVDATAAATKEVEFEKAWYAEHYIIGQQVYKYTKSGDATTYYMTEAEATWCGLTDADKGEAVEGVVHYGSLAKDWSNLDSYKIATTRVLDEDFYGQRITKDAAGNPLQAVDEDGAIYSNIDGNSFAGASGRFVNYKAIDADATYYYTVNTTKSYSDEEFAQLQANEEAAGVATWEKSVDKNGLITWTRTSATGEVSTYEADYANVKTADKGNYKYSEIATGAVVIKNGSVVLGDIENYKDVTVTDSKVGYVWTDNYISEEKWDGSTKKGKIDAKTNQQTITTTDKYEYARKYTVIGNFTLSNSKDRLDDTGAIEQSAGDVEGYETVTITNATVGDFDSYGASERKETSKEVTDYSGDADDLRADYVNDWQALANTGREGDGKASYVVSKVTSCVEEDKEKRWAAGTFEATGRDYTFDVADKNRANEIGDIYRYDQVTLTNVNAGDVRTDVTDWGQELNYESTSKESYTVKSNAKTGKDTVTNAGNNKKVKDSDGTLVATNDVTDTKNESDLTIASIGGFQNVSLTNVSVTEDIESTAKSTETANGSATQEFDASTIREVNKEGGQYYNTSAGEWDETHEASKTTWNSTTGDNISGKLTSSKLTTKYVSTPDAVLTAQGQFSTAAVENDAVLNKYTQAFTGRELYLTEDEAEDLIGDESTATGLKLGWTKDAKQYYARETETGATILGAGTLTNLKGTIATAKYTNGKTKGTLGYEEYFFTADEAVIAKLADSTLTLATGTEASSRLRCAGGQDVTDVSTGTKPGDSITGTAEVRKYNNGLGDLYLTDAEFAAGKDTTYTGYTLVEAEKTTWYVRQNDAGADKTAAKIFAKEGADTIYTYTNKQDETDVRYATDNEFAILVANGDVEAEDYAKSETSAYRKAGNAAVAVDNSACTDVNNLFAAQAVSTVFKYDKDGQPSYYVTAEEFAALSVAGGVLEGYALDENSEAYQVMRFEDAKAASAGIIDRFLGLYSQGDYIRQGELYRTDLTDAEAKLLGITYDENNLRCYSANGVDEWNDAAKTKVGGSIYNFKTVALDTMNVLGSIDNGHDEKSDSSNSYSKSVSSKKGSDVYTEKSSLKSSYVANAVGSIELVDTDVAGTVRGYDKVSISTKDATSTIGGVEKSYGTKKYTHDINVKTTDATAYFEQEYTEKTTNSTVSNAKGDLEVAGLKAAEDLVIDQSKHFDTAAEAAAEAQKQIDAFGEKKDADIRITGNIKGFKNVSLTNVTLGTVTGGSKEINAYSTKEDRTGSTTTYSLTGNQYGNLTVRTAESSSTSFSNSIGGDLELVNVNLAVKYNATSEAKETEDAAKVDTYLFNGKYYALTADEMSAFLPYAYVTAGVNQARLNASVKTQAAEVVEGQSMLTVTDNGKSGIAKDDVYYKTSKVVDPAALEKTYYYVYSYYVGDWLNDPANKGETVDTSKAYYAANYMPQEIEATDLIAADVSKYVYNGTTVYLTEGEAAVLGATATTDTAKYTRCLDTGDAASYVFKTAVKDDGTNLVEVNKYIGTDTTGKKEYYLTADEFTGFVGANVLNGTFAKVDDTKYQRIGLDKQTTFTDATLAAVETAVDTNGLGYGKANIYSSDGTMGGVLAYASADEFAKLQKLDATFKDYTKVDTGADVYYLKGASIFVNNITDANLNDYRAVNESAEVYEVSNKLNGAVIGYLTYAEWITLRDNAAAGAEAFEEIYQIDELTTYLRVADDTNNLIKINGVDGEGYVVEAADTLKSFGYNVADKYAALAAVTANGFKTITMTDSELSGADGSLTTYKSNDKLTSKKGDKSGTYTASENVTVKSNVGTFTAVDGVNNVYGEVKGYKTVTLAGELDEEGKTLSNFSNFSGGMSTSKSTASGKVELKNADYVSGDIYDGKFTEQSVWNSDGKLEATNVTLGNVSGYKTVKVAFDATDDEKVLAKHTVGGIYGGSSDYKKTATVKTVNGVKITDKNETTKFNSVGSADVANATVYNINGFEKVNVIGSKVLGTVSGGKSVTKKYTLLMNDVEQSTDTVVESTAFGQAMLADSSVAGDVTGFKKVAFTDGVKVDGDVRADVDNYEENPSRGTANTVCYAVTYGYDYVNKHYDSTVYLTVDEYKVFVKDENYADAQIDLSVSTYRTQAEIENPTAADVGTMAGFIANTEEPKDYTFGYGYNGADPVETIVKAYGQDFSIDTFGAEIGGKVSGYQKVTVNGDSSFGGGYEGTKKADKLVVNADLATFGKLDFGEGKDTLEFNNGTFGTDVEFKDWNLEEVKVAKNATGTMVVKSDDVAAVKAAFTDVEVYGSDNYSKTSALEGLEMGDDTSIKLSAGDETRKEWLGFCDETDYFAAQTAGTLKLDGEIFDKGVATAKVSYDDGETWKTVKDGDELFAGADVKVFLDQDAKNKVSNDYTISIA